MANEELTTEASPEEPEEALTEEAPDPKAALEESQSTIASLRAMLASLAPDIDVDAELDNVAFRRDGTPVYVGEIKELKTEDKPKVKPARSRPAETRGGTGKVSVKAMDDKGLAASVAKNGMRQFSS